MNYPITDEQTDALRHRCTQRQIQVITLLANGKSFKQAAVELKVSIRTVRRHVDRAKERMDVNTLAELVAKLVALEVISVTFARVDQSV